MAKIAVFILLVMHAACELLTHSHMHVHARTHAHAQHALKGTWCGSKKKFEFAKISSSLSPVYSSLVAD